MDETMETAAPVLRPVQRIKFDRWLFDFNIDNATAARLLNCHPLTIGRYRKLFDDPNRPKPNADFIRAVEQLTAGAVTFEDWFRPCDVTYDACEMASTGAVE